MSCALASLPSSTASPYSDAVLAAGPLAYYRFAETVCDVATDSSGNAVDGLYAMVDGFERGEPSAHENLGHALHFVGGYMVVPPLGVHSQTTIEGWLQFFSNVHDGCSAIYATNGWSTGSLHLNLARAGNVLEHAVNGDDRSRWQC